MHNEEIKELIEKIEEGITLIGLGDLALALCDSREQRLKLSKANDQIRDVMLLSLEIINEYVS